MQIPWLDKVQSQHEATEAKEPAALSNVRAWSRRLMASVRIGIMNHKTELTRICDGGWGGCGVLFPLFWTGGEGGGGGKV